MVTKTKILLVEDEAKIRQLLETYLTNQGFEVVWAPSGFEGWAKFKKMVPDLVLLDLTLPGGMDGLELCRKLRAQSNVPIIMLTARSEEVDKLLGLELGADDYITKPFSPREVVARIKAVLRRSARGDAGDEPEVLRVGPIVISLTEHEVKVGGEPVSLTPSEFNLLVTLLKHPGRVYTRLQLQDAALGGAYDGYERTVDAHISNLRRKIEDDPAHPRYILTVFGIGYKGGKDSG